MFISFPWTWWTIHWTSSEHPITTADNFVKGDSILLKLNNFQISCGCFFTNSILKHGKLRSIIITIHYNNDNINWPALANWNWPLPSGGNHNYRANTSVTHTRRRCPHGWCRDWCRMCDLHFQLDALLNWHLIPHIHVFIIDDKNCIWYVLIRVVIARHICE